MLTNLIGISASSYVSSDRDWTVNPGKELTQFLEKVGEEKFEEANKKYNTKIKDELKTLKNDPSYEILSNEDKEKEVNKLKNKTKKEIFKEYNFKYKE